MPSDTFPNGDPAATAYPAPARRGRNDPFPRLRAVQVPLDKLKPASRQVRRASKRQIAKIRRSIARFGFVAPVLVTADGEVIDGHAGLEAARELGAATIPCVVVDHLDEAEIRQLRIALNRIQETGEWDHHALRLEFEDLLELDVDLEITGFDAPEIDGVLEIGGGAAKPDPLDDIGDMFGEARPIVSASGDLWLLGGHRLLCGNARSTSDVARAVGDRRAAMIFTDPPYNLPIAGHVRTARDGRFREFAEASGEMSEEEFEEFLVETLGAAADHAEPGALAYVFMDWRHMAEILTALRRIGCRLVNLCTWVKPSGGMGSFYRSRHELVFVAARGSASHRNNVQLGRFGRNRTNVWEYAGATGGARSTDDDFAIHPTVKPVRLVADAILDASAVGETVLDPFLGSGTTLLAAERTRRRCVGVELDPAYVDVAIRRWMRMTGSDAVHAETGETFAERERLAVAAERDARLAAGSGQGTSNPCSGHSSDGEG